MCQTRIYTNTNTQIHKYSKSQSARKIVQGYQKLYSHMLNAQIQEYKYTNIQIQHMTKCQKDPTCGIFSKKVMTQGYQI